MFITDEPKKKFVRITQTDSAWTQTNGLATCTRAALEISPHCPSNISWIIQDALNKGWIRQVAYVDEKSLMWETLQK